MNTTDQLSSLYSVSKKTRQWPLVVLVCLQNTAGINTRFIVASNKRFEEQIVRRKFMHDFGFSLVRPHMETSVMNLKLPKKLRL